MGVMYGETQTDGLIQIDYLQNHDMGIDSTEIHEYIHSVLIEESPYGKFLFLLDLISTIDCSYLKLVSFFKDNMYNVQEITANTVEYLSFYKCNGKENFYKSLNTLKLDNYKYYQFINKFKFLIDDDRISIDKKISIVFWVGIECLNINLTNIDLNFMEEKKIKKFTRQTENSLLYLPNSRFSEISSKIKKYLKETKDDLDLNEIEKITYSLNENFDISLEVLVNYMERLTCKSKFNLEINRILNKAKYIEKNIGDLPNTQIVSLNDSYEYKELNYKEFESLNNEDQSIIFIKAIDSKNYRISNLKDKLNEINYICINSQEKKKYIIKDLDLYTIVDNKKFIKVIYLSSYFVIEYSTLNILDLKDLYVISDISYLDLKIYHKEFLYNQYKFRLMQFPNFYAVIINLEKDINLILLMNYETHNTFLDDIKNGICNFEGILTEKLDQYDELIIKNKNCKEVYNNIVNSYLQS